MKNVLWAVLVLSISLSPAGASDCMRSEDEEVAEGYLSLGRFKDAADRPETAYILTLPVPTCLADPDPDMRVDDANAIHLYSSNDDLYERLNGYVGKTVLVRGRPFGAHTAHHHAPIVMDISEIDEQ